MVEIVCNCSWCVGRQQTFWTKFRVTQFCGWGKWKLLDLNFPNDILPFGRAVQETNPISEHNGVRVFYVGALPLVMQPYIFACILINPRKPRLTLHAWCGALERSLGGRYSSDNSNSSNSAPLSSARQVGGRGMGRVRQLIFVHV